MTALPVARAEQADFKQAGKERDSGGPM